MEVNNKVARTIDGASAKLSFSELKLHIEALLFASDGPLEIGEIRAYLSNISLGELKLALKDLSKEYENRAFFIFENNGKYQLRTKEEFAFIVHKMFQSKPRSLSKSSLETLSIIAYKQPVTRAEINAIRGVESASIIAVLKERDLIYVLGNRKEIGNPLEYKTTPKFLEIFGMKSIKDLPNLRSLQMSQRETETITEALKDLNEIVQENL